MAIKEHFKRPTRIKPDPKGCLEAAGKHIKPPTRTKPDPKGCFKAIREHIKPPTWMKPDPKGFVRAATKPFRWMLLCAKRPKDEDDCPGLPEVKVSYVDEDIPESLASRSRISLTDSESDGCPAEADLESLSDSLEGIPEMLEAESLPSLMETEEEKEAGGEGKDGEKDLGSHDPSPAEVDPNPGPALDSSPQPQVTHAETIPETLVLESISSLTDSSAGLCPIEADPGPRADRVPEPQERSSDEQLVGQEFHGNDSGTPLTEENLHRMCQKFPSYSKEEKRLLVDNIAFGSLDVMLEHFLKSQETACDELICAVFRSPHCNHDICLNHFFVKLNENQMQDSQELPLPKVKALRGVRAIVKDHSNNQDLNDWLQAHFVTLGNILVSQFHPKKQGSNGKAKMYLVPGEAIDILAILFQRLDLVYHMKAKFYL